MLGVAAAGAGLVTVSAALGPPPGLPHLGGLRIDAWVLSIVALLSVIASLVFGLAPALTAVQLASNASLAASGSKAGLPHREGRFRVTLVAAQVALAEVLLIGATLLSISYVRLHDRDLHFDPKGLLSFTYAVPAAAFARPLAWEDGVPAFDVSPTAAQTVQQVHEQLRAIAGGESAAGISYPPVNSLVLPLLPVTATDDPSPCRTEPVAYFLVTPGVFATLKTPLVSGREFDHRDEANAPWGIVINEAMAARCWPGQAAVGRRLRIEAGPEERVREVIGVVPNIPARLNERDPRAVMYASYRQQPAHYRGPAVGMFGGMTFILRPSGSTARVLDDARVAVAAVTPDRPIVEVGTVDAHRLGRRGQDLAYVLTTVIFAVSAMLLAMVGLNGLLGHAVNARLGELAVRKALGANAQELLRRIAGPTAWLIAGGLSAGVIVAVAATPWLRPQLWGVTSTDPAAFAAASAVLLVATIAACAVPLRHALAVDPAARLRAE